MFNPTALITKWVATSTPRQKLIAALLVFSLLATGALFAVSSASETATDPLGSTPLYFTGVLIKLIGILLLIVGSSVLLRRWMHLGPNGKTTNQLRLLETVRLSPKQCLHLVVIGNQQLLIGATDQSIALIAPVDGAVNPIPVEAPQLQMGMDFGSILQSINFHLPSDSLERKG